MSESNAARAYCYRCMRVQSMCLCADLSLCSNRTEIHVLQHPKERRHAFGTVRLLKIGLEKLKVYNLESGQGGSHLMPEGFPLDAGILYPGPGSLDLAELSQDDKPSKLVVIDGTWSQAHCMYRDTPWLQKLTRYRLHPTEPSRYQIRKEPSFECLSTLESTVMALSLLEPETPGIEGLSHAFELMNHRQVEVMKQRAGEPARFKNDRPRPMRAVPPVLWAEPSRVVVVYAESAFPFQYQDGGVRELAQWSAVRLAESHSFFDSIVKTAAPMPSGEYLQNLKWTAEQLDSAKPLASLRERWHEFLRPDDVVVAWNKGTLQVARRHDLIEEGIVLKQIYSNTTERNLGTLDDVVAHDSLEPVAAPAIAGRAAHRLMNAHAAAMELGRWARHHL